MSHGDDRKLLDIALALDPKVLLLDEPTAGMGPEERWRMIDKVRELCEMQKITVVFIEHDMDTVFKIAICSASASRCGRARPSRCSAVTARASRRR